MVRWSNFLDMGLQSLGYIYQLPCYGKKGVLFAVIVLLVTFYFYYLIILQISNTNGDVTLLAKSIESLTSFAQMGIKLTPLLINRGKFALLLNEVEYFWDPTDFPEEVLKKAESWYKFAYYWQNIYRYTVLATLILFYLQPFITKQLLLICWIPDYPYAFEILLGTQYIYGMIIASYMTGFDIIYVSFCTHLTVQMMLLNYTVKAIKMDGNYVANLKRCVQHHRFLIRFVEKMLEIYSISMLGQYVISIYLTCMEIYLFAENLKNIGRLLLSTTYFLCIMFQLGLYCFPATAVSEEAMNLSVFVYDSNWYDGPIPYQKDVAIMLIRSQKELKFKAAGLAEMNRETYIIVLKSSLSFYALMRQLNEK